MTGLAGQQYDNMCANWGAAANYPGLTNPAMVSEIYFIESFSEDLV